MHKIIEFEDKDICYHIKCLINDDYFQLNEGEYWISDKIYQCVPISKNRKNNSECMNIRF